MADIIQADREAAAKYLYGYAFEDLQHYVRAMHSGRHDDVRAVKAFAAHRLAQIAAIEEPSPELVEVVSEAFLNNKKRDFTSIINAMLAAAALHLKENG